MADPLPIGTTVFGLNPKYKDGTRLRHKPTASKDASAFNGVWFANDSSAELVAHAVASDDGALMYEVRKPDGDQGWIRARNVTTSGRVSGITKDVVSSEMITPDAEYVHGVKIWGCGIKQDPVPGAKLGKGVQHLISSQWLNAISEFIAAHFRQCQAMLRHAFHVSEGFPWDTALCRKGRSLARAAAGPAATRRDGYDFSYFTNLANHLFNRADVLGLKSHESEEYFLMATFLVMCAAEVDHFPFSKYSEDERADHRWALYCMWLDPPTGPGSVDAPHDDADVLGKFASPASRRDLLPPVAIERLGINNELSSLKYRDPTEPMREGFLLSKRVDSLKRHFEGVHRRMYDEDHVIHLLWNLHAIFHVNVVFPSKNDLVDYAAITARQQQGDGAKQGYIPTTSREKIAAITATASRTAAAVLKLDWNEGTISPPKSVLDALQRLVLDVDGAFLKWYPQLGGGAELRLALAAYCNAVEENILVTNGSDDALILVCQAFLGNSATHGEHPAVVCPCPTYEHFCINAVAAGGQLIRTYPKDPFRFCVDEVTRWVEEHRPQVVYIVSPNNPSGSECSASDISNLVHRFPSTLFIVDEAYYEFASHGADGKPITCVPLALQHQNVIVTRTFSKAFCLASVRCGYVVAHPTTIEKLRCYYNPKSVNQFAQVAALNALNEFATYYAPYVRLTNESRQQFIAALSDRGVAVRSGGAGNFVCIEVPGGKTKAFCDAMETQQIYVRDISGRFPGYVRITVGLEMQRVVDATVEAFAAVS